MWHSSSYHASVTPVSSIGVYSQLSWVEQVCTAEDFAAFNGTSQKCVQPMHSAQVVQHLMPVDSRNEEEYGTRNIEHVTTQL